LKNALGTFKEFKDLILGALKIFNLSISSKFENSFRNFRTGYLLELKI